MEIYGMTGEKLGVIGPVEADALAELPQWKRDFLSKPSISLRKGIAWGYSAPYEDTSTLVLTSPAGDFVDIRFPTKPDASRPLAADPAFWAFSGKSSTRFDTDGGDTIAMPYSAHAVFVHGIDSKGPGITDEGDMFLLPNGDCIEVGIMQNPRSGQPELYKEYWTAPSTERPGGVLPRAPCLVAKTLTPPSAGRDEVSRGEGVIVRIGDHCQGIVQTSNHDGPGEIFVERWSRMVSSAPGESEAPTQVSSADWLKDWRSNTPLEEQVDVLLPCMWLCSEQRQINDEIVAQGSRWRIVEVV